MKYNTLHIFLLVLALLGGGAIFHSRIAVASDTGVVNATVQLAVCGDGVKDYGEQCDTHDFGGKSCSSLGYDGGTLNCSPACQLEVTECTTDSSASSTTTLSPSSDRTYILPDAEDSVGIFLPQDFHHNDLSLFLFSDPTAPAKPTGQNLVGKLYRILFLNENADTVHSLLKASRLTLTYSDSDLAGGTIDETTLAPYRSEDDGHTWSAVPGYTLDRTQKTITFSTNEFSAFSIFGSPVTTHTTTTTTGGGSSGGAVFAYGTVFPKATPEQKKQIVTVADFNGDGLVDITDLSILLYYYEHTGWQVARYDLNSDKTVDIVDVSVMLYYWEVTS